MITLSDIQAAAGRIRESIYLSPCPRSEAFSKLTGSHVYLKLDNQQRTGAFKERGALNKLLTMTESERQRGINIDSLLQKPGYLKSSLPFVITLEACPTSALDKALTQIAKLDFLVKPCLDLPILDSVARFANETS